MPYYDNTPYSRHAIPTWGGNACVFRLEDAYALEESTFTIASFRGVNQSVRYQRTAEWLKQPDGVWRNGWYEDTQGIRWYSDVLSSAPGPPFDMHHRSFDMRTGEEVDCFKPENCEAVARVGQWGDKFISSDKGHAFTAVYIANGSEYGLFLYEGDEIHTIRAIFDWETLVSNLSVGLVLIRWVLALVSLHSGAYRGKSLWFSGGIGCVSGAGSFRYLPLASLPRLKMTLAVFWTVGCRFEGQQAGLAESWFVMYPGIANFVLIYFSLLNCAAKALRRRISDALFTPTVVFLCLLHYFRLEIAESGWLKGVDGRIATVVFSDEAAKLHLSDFFTSDLAWRINGRVKLLFGLKFALLGVNLLPLVMVRPFPIRKPKTDLKLHGVEKALAIRAKYVGGLGCSLTYMVVKVDRKENCVSSMSFTDKLVCTTTEKNIFLDADDLQMDGGRSKSTLVAPNAHSIASFPHSHSTTDMKELKATSQPSKLHEIALVNSYELIRLGYLVFGDKYLITFDEWDLLSSMAPFRSFCHFWNHRVLVWTLRPVVADGDAEIAGARALQSTEPQMWRLDDARLQRVRWWQVSACGIQC